MQCFSDNEDVVDIERISITESTNSKHWLQYILINFTQYRYCLIHIPLIMHKLTSILINYLHVLDIFLLIFLNNTYILISINHEIYDVLNLL